MSRAREVSGLHSAVRLGMYKAHADSTGVELVVVDLLLFVSCGCWYTHHRYRRRRRVTTTKPLTDHVHKSRHVERVGDGNLRLLRGQGLRRRLLRQALLRAPPVCLEPSSVLRPHACFAACTPTANSPTGLPCALLTACYVCCHAHRARRASGAPPWRRPVTVPAAAAAWPLAAVPPALSAR